MSVFRGVGECLFSEADIDIRCKELAEKIDFHYSDTFAEERKLGLCDGLGTVGFMPVMSGAMQFCSKLLNYGYPFYVKLCPVFASSYKHGTQRGPIETFYPGGVSHLPEHILVVEDIIDTGHTSTDIIETLSRLGFKVSICTLLRKKRQEVSPREVFKEFVGFHCPDEFVVGFGLDYKGLLRNTSGIHVFHEEKVCESS